MCWPRSTTPSPGAPFPRRSATRSAGSEAARVTPRFDSVRFGAPAYGRLSTAAPPELARGAHDEGELGAYHFLWLAYRESQLQSGLPAYAPIGTGHRRPVRHLGDMMYGDFSRMTYSRAKAYTGVWSQQGRVQLDADANEQTAIVLDWLRTLAVDFIGPFGGHVTRAGFHVELKDADLTFSPGHYYVYGLRCEIPEPAEQGAAGATYRSLVPGAGRPARAALPGATAGLGAIGKRRADPDLLEPALGPYPPDTTVRTPGGLDPGGQHEPCRTAPSSPT